MNDNKEFGHDGPGSGRVPEQTTGSEMDAVTKVTFDSPARAGAVYEMARARLLDVNKWGEMAKLPMSAFKLFDAEGRAAERRAEKGDYIRIDIPGPGIVTGHGYDWVVIEELTDDRSANAEVTTIRVRPSAHPLGEDGHTAHFLKDTATSTFQVKRIANEVTAEEHGRNEEANLETGNLLDNVRNAFVGFGAKLGFSYPQWKSLVAGLLDTPAQ